MRNKRNNIIFLISLIAILIFVSYSVFIYKQKSLKQDVLLSKDKSELAHNCSILSQRQFTKDPFLTTFFCGVNNKKETINLDSQKDLESYLKENKALAISLNPAPILKHHFCERGECESRNLVNNLPARFSVCFLLHPDFSYNKTNQWEVFPKETIASIYKDEINLAVCSPFMKLEDIPNFVVAGDLVKEGMLWEKYKNTSFSNIDIEMYISKDIENKINQSNYSLSKYFLNHPSDFTHIGDVYIPL